MRRRQTLVPLLGLLASLALAPRADASLILAGTIGGQNFCAADNGIGCTWGTVLVDTDPTLGRLALAPTLLGGMQVDGSLQIQTIGAQNVLNSSSLQITNTTGGTLGATLAVGGTNFAGPSFVAFTSGSGTWENAQGSSMTMTWYNDPLNSQGAETPADRPGTLLQTFSHNASLILPSDSFANSGGPFAVNDPALFSMTLGFDLSLTGGGRLVSKGQTEIKPQAAVPEPATLTLMGFGLVGLAGRIRKRYRA